MSCCEPTELEMALYERHHSAGFPYIGPLTRDQMAKEVAYEQYNIDSLAEHELQMKHGGRELCPQCNKRGVLSSAVCTLGYPGHPGAEFSTLRECEFCDYKEL